MTDLKAARERTVRAHMVWLMGTHLGPIKMPRGEIPPTGRKFKVKMSAVFEFAPGSDKMISERPYVDPRAIQLQLGLMNG